MSKYSIPQEQIEEASKKFSGAYDYGKMTSNGKQIPHVGVEDGYVEGFNDAMFRFIPQLENRDEALRVALEALKTYPLIIGRLEEYNKAQSAITAIEGIK